MLSRRVLLASTLAAAAIPTRAAESPWIDAHTHVFVRGLTPAANARYALDYDASWQTLLDLAAKNGVGRAVILQPSFLGFDNTYLLEALRAAPDRFRGVPWVSPSITVSDCRAP